jgi:hypothetical protein
VIAESCLAVGQTLLLVRSTRVPVPLAAVRAATIECIAGGATLLIPGVPSLVRTAAGTSIYVAGLAVQRRLPPELGHMFEGRLRPSGFR